MTQIASKRVWVSVGVVALFLAVGSHATANEPAVEKSYYTITGASSSGSGCSSKALVARTEEPDSPESPATTLAAGDFVLAGLLCAALVYGHRHGRH